MRLPDGLQVSARNELRSNPRAGLFRRRGDLLLTGGEHGLERERILAPAHRLPGEVPAGHGDHFLHERLAGSVERRGRTGGRDQERESQERSGQDQDEGGPPAWCRSARARRRCSGCARRSPPPAACGRAAPPPLSPRSRRCSARGRRRRCRSGARPSWVRPSSPSFCHMLSPRRGAPSSGSPRESEEAPVPGGSAPIRTSPSAPVCYPRRYARRPPEKRLLPAPSRAAAAQCRRHPSGPVGAHTGPTRGAPPRTRAPAGGLGGRVSLRARPCGSRRRLPTSGGATRLGTAARGHARRPVGAAVRPAGRAPAELARSGAPDAPRAPLQPPHREGLRVVDQAVVAPVDLQRSIRPSLQ
jgi:hypothetical protein